MTGLLLPLALLVPSVLLVMGGSLVLRRLEPRLSPARFAAAAVAMALAVLAAIVGMAFAVVALTKGVLP